MIGQGAMQDGLDPVIERMVGETGEPGQIAGTARACGERALPSFLAALNGRLCWPVEIEISAVDIIRFADARPPQGCNAALVVAAAPSSPDALLLTLDTAAVSLLMAALLGADPEFSAPTIARPLSPIELEAASTLFADFVQAFGGSGPRGFDFRLPLPAPLTGQELRKLVIRDGPAVRIDFSVFAQAGSGSFSVVMPQRVLMAHRGDRQKSAAAPNIARQWNARFGEEILRSSVRLDAAVTLQPMTLGDLTRLEVGQVLEFPEGGASEARLSSRNRPIFICEFGKLGQNYTVKVRHEFDAGKDFIEGLIAR